MSAAAGRLDTESEAAAIVRQTVRLLTMRGCKVPHAMEDAARELELSPRKLRRLYTGEPVARICEEEYIGLLGRFIRCLDREANDLQMREARIRARAAQLERQRALLGGSGACADGSPQSPPGGICAASAARYGGPNASSDASNACEALERAAAKRRAFQAARERARRT